MCVLVRLLHGVPVETEKSILIEQKPFVGNFWESSSEEGLGSPWNCCRLVGKGEEGRPIETRTKLKVDFFLLLFLRIAAFCAKRLG